MNRKKLMSRVGLIALFRLICYLENTQLKAKPGLSKHSELFSPASHSNHAAKD